MSIKKIFGVELTLKQKERIADVLKEYFLKEGEKYERKCGNREDCLVMNLSKIEKIDEKVSKFFYSNWKEVEEIIKEVLNRHNIEIMIKKVGKNQRISPSEATKPDFKDKMVEVEGVITMVSPICSYIHLGFFRCPKCLSDEVKEFDFLGEFSETYKCKCKKGNMELIKNTIKNFQILELADLYNVGSIPLRLTVYIPHHLIDYFKTEKKQLLVGETVRIRGIIKHLTKKKKKTETYPIMLAYDWEVRKQEFKITQEEEEKIVELSKNPNIIDILANSFCPSIYGRREIKEALMLQIVRGNKEVDEYGKQVRDTIHILLVGDPATGKTTLGNYIVRNYFKAKYTTGSELTNAGLSASMRKDKTTGQWLIDPGVLVLSHKGIAVIDEADKVSAEELRSLDVVMENQFLPVNKAGISAEFPAETSVLAIANPKFGRFDTNSFDLNDQIKLPETTLTRFDLKFVLLDKPDEHEDERIAETFFNKTDNNREETLLKPDFLMKYLVYASKLKPQMTEEAINVLKDFYLKMRTQTAEKGAIGITPRQLGSLKRIAIAYAKLRMSDKVEEQDVEKAIDLFLIYLSNLGANVEYEKGELKVETIDIDKAEGRRGKTRKKKTLIIKEIIEQMDDGKGAVLDEVIEELVSQKIFPNKEEAEDFIKELSKEGILMNPSINKIKVV